MKVFVYRVQDSDEVGPYRTDHTEVSEYFCNKHQDDDDHPAPWAPVLPGRWQTRRFGFESIEKLFSWFNGHKDRGLLHDYDFKVTIWEVDAELGILYADEYQVAFSLEHATHVDTMSIWDAYRCVLKEAA